MLTRLGGFTVRRRRLVLSFTALFIVVAAVLGTRAFGVMEDEGFEDPSSESYRAGHALRSASTPAARDRDRRHGRRRRRRQRRQPSTAGVALTEALQQSRACSDVTSYWTSGTPPSLRSDSRRFGADPRAHRRQRGRRRGRSSTRSVTRSTGAGRASIVGVGGGEAVSAEFGTTIEGDLARAESIAIPITLVLLVLVFGGLVAASLPLFVGVHRRARHVPVAVRDRLAHRRVGLRHQPHHGARARSRDRLQPVHRVPLPGGAAPRRAPWRTPSCAPSRRPGAPSRSARSPWPCRSSALLVFPQYFLRSFAYAGIAVVLLAMVGVDRRPARPAGRRRSPHRLAARAPPAASRGPRRTGSGTARRHGSCAARFRWRSAWSPCSCCSASRSCGCSSARPTIACFPESAPLAAGLGDPAHRLRGRRLGVVPRRGHRRSPATSTAPSPAWPSGCRRSTGSPASRRSTGTLRRR